MAFHLNLSMCFTNTAKSSSSCWTEDATNGWPRWRTKRSAGSYNLLISNSALRSFWRTEKSARSLHPTAWGLGGGQRLYLIHVLLFCPEEFKNCLAFSTPCLAMSYLINHGRVSRTLVLPGKNRYHRSLRRWKKWQFNSESPSVLLCLHK